MRTLHAGLWLCLWATVVLAEKKEFHGKSTHEGKAGKQHHLAGRWGEHWSMSGKPTGKHEPKDAMKHAPDFVPRHEAKLQTDLGHKKHNQEKHKPLSDLHLQDLLMEESQRHETRVQKIQKVRPTHSTHHHQEGHQIPKPRPTMADLPHANHGHLEGRNHYHHNKPTPSINHKGAKVGHQGGKPGKFHSKEKKLDKKFPKKFNPRKHEKKALIKH